MSIKLHSELMPERDVVKGQTLLKYKKPEKGCIACEYTKWTKQISPRINHCEHNWQAAAVNWDGFCFLHSSPNDAGLDLWLKHCWYHSSDLAEQCLNDIKAFSVSHSAGPKRRLGVGKRCSAIKAGVGELFLSHLLFRDWLGIALMDGCGEWFPPHHLWGGFVILLGFYLSFFLCFLSPSAVRLSLYWHMSFFDFVLHIVSPVQIWGWRSGQASHSADTCLLVWLNHIKQHWNLWS